MEALDPYRVTDRLEDVLLDVMVSRLEARGKHWFFQKVLGEYLDAWTSIRLVLCWIWAAEQEWRHVRSLVERIS